MSGRLVPAVRFILGASLVTALITACSEESESPTDPGGEGNGSTSGRLYWYSSGEILRSDDAGGNREVVVSGIGFPSGLAVDPADGYVYWTEFAWPTGPVLLRAPADGSGDQEVLVDRGHVPARQPRALGIDVVNRRLYWTAESWFGVAHSDLFGDSIDYWYEPAGGRPHRRSMDVDGKAGYVFFEFRPDGYPSTAPGRIRRVTLETGAVMDIVTGLPGESPLRVFGRIVADADSRQLYWSNYWDFNARGPARGLPGEIHRCNYNGSASELVLTHQYDIMSLAVASEAGYLFFASSEGGIFRTTLGGDNEVKIQSEGLAYVLRFAQLAE